MAPPDRYTQDGGDRYTGNSGRAPKKGRDRMEALGLLAPGDAAKPTMEGAAAAEAKRKFLRIDSFEGAFDYLALEAKAEAGWDGTMFPTARHALLAAQFPAGAEAIAKAPSVAEAIKAAEGESEIDDWQHRRLKDLEKILRDKFRRHADLRKKLKETEDRELIWENEEDGFWGAVKGKGQNRLGQLLAEIRTSIQDDTEFQQWLHVCCEIEERDANRPPVELIEMKTQDGQDVDKKVHRLSGKAVFKLGKMPTGNDVVALHPSISREHSMLIHTKSSAGRRSQGIVLVDMGSKAGTSIGDRRLPHAWLMEPVRSGDLIRLAASTRTLEMKINLESQIALLEAQQRELLREAKTIEADGDNPLEAAKRAAKEESTVFVGNLEYETEKADLLGLFQDCGHIEECRFPGPAGKDGGGCTKAVKGICFVVFDTPMAARRACGLNFELFKGRKVKVAPASENRSEDKGGGKGHKDGGKDGKGKGKGGGKGKDGGDMGGKGDWQDLTGKGEGKGEDSRSIFMQASARFRNRSRSGSGRQGGGGGGESARRGRSPTMRELAAEGSPRHGDGRRDRRGDGAAERRDRSRSRDAPQQPPPRRSRRGDAGSSGGSAAGRSRSRGRRRKEKTRAPSPSSASSDRAKKKKRRRD